MTPFRSSLAMVPFLLGLAMCFPYLVWAVLATMIMPGSLNGFDSHASTALFVVSIPLVMWFFLCSLGFISNSIAGANEFAPSRTPIVAWTVAALPALTMILAVAAVFALTLVGKPWKIAVLPVLLGGVIAAAIVVGERARVSEAGWYRRQAGANGSRR